jgi:hypothetical protein
MKSSIQKKVVLLVFLLICLSILFFISRPKNCGEDITCFDNSAGRCSKAKVATVYSDMHNYEYEILGKKDENCIIQATLLKASPDISVELRKVLEGKSMLCAIPKEMLKEKSITKVEHIIDYCNGLLKETFLQITIDEMYNLIVKNLGIIKGQV